MERQRTASAELAVAKAKGRSSASADADNVAEILPLSRDPAAVYAARIVIPEPGSYDLTLVGHSIRPADERGVYDEATGNWITLKLTNVVTGEAVFPVMRPDLRYQPPSSRRTQV